MDKARRKTKAKPLASLPSPGASAENTPAARIPIAGIGASAGEADLFDDAIQKLLTEMAADISFAMDSYAATAAFWP